MAEQSQSQSQSQSQPQSTTATISTSPSGSKKYFTTNNPFEQKFGYHRAIRKGPFIFVSGTTALKSQHDLQSDSRSSLTSTETTTLRQQQRDTNSSEGVDDDDDDDDNDNDDEKLREQILKSHVHGWGSSYEQAVIAMRRCIDAVERLGGTAGDVVRVKMFVGSPDYCGDVGNAFRKCFGPSTEGGTEAGEVGATATMIVVQDGFVDKDIRVEVEVDAVVL